MNYEEKKKELLICICLGWIGVHKFYKRKIILGILYLITGGIFLIGWIYDIIALLKELNNIKYKNNLLDLSEKNNNVNIESIILNNKTNKVNAIKEYRQKTGASLKEANDIIENFYNEMGINYNKRICPKCGSENCYAFVEDKVVLKGKTKTQTSINLNPLKPFTVFNHKEKVVREPWTMQVSKFICNDCGKIFQ